MLPISSIKSTPIKYKLSPKVHFCFKKIILCQKKLRISISFTFLWYNCREALLKSNTTNPSLHAAHMNRIFLSTTVGCHCGNGKLHKVSRHPSYGPELASCNQLSTGPCRNMYLSFPDLIVSTCHPNTSNLNL